MRSKDFVHRSPRINDRAVARSSGSGLRNRIGRDQAAIRMVARHASRAMKHGQRLVGILVDPHRDLHLMESVSVRWNLQTPALIAHRIVLGHDAVLLHAEDLGERRSSPRDEGGARLRRWHRNAPVVGRENLGDQILIRRRPVGDPGERQFFGQPVLQGAEAVQGPFSLHKEGRIEPTRGIIERRNQIPLTARDPFMGRAVLMQPHPR